MKLKESDLTIDQSGNEIRIRYYCLINKINSLFTMTSGDYFRLKKEGGYAKMYNEKHKLK
jgi:hypothetical protein